MTRLRLSFLSTAMIFSSVLGSVVDAQSISLDFSQNAGNQVFAGGELIGPLATDSATWNSTNDVVAPDTLAAGSLTTLIDNSGATVPGATVSWISRNTWYSGDGTADDEHKMAVGYLDDGDDGADITFENIPYPIYRVYGLLASDQGGTTIYDTLDFVVNGTEVFGAATTAPAFNTIEESMAQTGSFWSLADGTNRGNYWSVVAQGPTLTIDGTPRDNASRGSITAVIIKQIPEPTSLGLVVMALCGLLVSRRKR